MNAPTSSTRIGWIGAGRMGFAMAERLAQSGAAVTVWNRTRAKADPLAKAGATIADHVADLASCDIVFCMVSTWDDLEEVIGGPAGLLSGLHGGAATPRLIVECSSISAEGSAELRAMLASQGIALLAAPVSGNAKVANAGRLAFVCSGPRDAFEAAQPLLMRIGASAAYVGEGELARMVKICHNVFLGVVTQSLAEITVLALKAGVPRKALLEFINGSVMGSTFTRYKTPAFVNLDFRVTFTPQLLRKDLDLGLDAARRHEVPMPLAKATRERVQAMIDMHLDGGDFARLLALQAQTSGIELTSENAAVDDGLG